MTSTNIKKALIMTGVSLASLLMVAACNSNSGASGYSGGGGYSGSGSSYSTGSTYEPAGNSNVANGMGWANQAQQNADQANQNEEQINDSNGIGDTVDSGDDGGN